MKTQDPFANPFWTALTTEQSCFALGEAPALRYPANIIPFAALKSVTSESLFALHHLLSPGESIYLVEDHLPDLTPYGMEQHPPFPVLQMQATPASFQPPPEASSNRLKIHPLRAVDAPAMVALTDAAFPGFFRSNTYRLGRYFGIHLEGELIAMAGERAALEGFRELSAVCTHPAHTGNGYAVRLIQHLLQVHAHHAEKSFLHVTESNTRALRLYQHLGFEITGRVQIHRIGRL